jgi:hypothetical protein
VGVTDADGVEPPDRVVVADAFELVDVVGATDSELDVEAGNELVAAPWFAPICHPTTRTVAEVNTPAAIARGLMK